MARGPIVVLGRPHSGTRMFAGLLRSSGVFLGADLTMPQLDSWSIHQRFVVPLVHARLGAGTGEESGLDLDHVARAFRRRLAALLPPAPRRERASGAGSAAKRGSSCRRCAGSSRQQSSSTSSATGGTSP
ncbi:MAG: hypothetical protein LC799_19125 [Actinobacteria bacterium]|nr:hypothetical protein [Actinomycetota bacterium]